ncbi:MAG: hypothetical protein IJX49_05985 [Clostridia bacterium]|nr:hypothetical protein [Clostridia bacterium]
MAQQKKGLITRLLEGKEKSEEYARSTLPTNRWQLFFDIFKGNFSKIVIVNLLILVFFLPLLALIVFGYIITDYNGTIYPFGANLAIGYPAYDGIRGLSQSLAIWSDLGIYIGIMLSSVLAAIGLAGGMYVIRNMVWTEGVFVVNDFWRGVKLNYKNALQTALFFCLVLTFCKTMINVSALSLAASDLSKFERVWLNISQGASYMFIGMALIMSLWMIALGVNYKMSFFAMFRNAFLMGLGTFPQTVFFGAIALAPLLLFMIGGTLFILIGALIMVIFGFSYALLVWLDFAQWVFDKYINPKIQGAKVGRGIYNKDGTSNADGSDSQASLEYQRIILSHGRSRLVARPIKPIDDSLQVYELPQSFTREDLKRLRESKQNIKEDTEAYAEEHKNDLRYVEYNKQFDERERALQEQDAKKGKKKKKLKPPKMLGE